MTNIAKKIEIRRKGDTNGFDLVIDGFVFPWHIERQDAEVENFAPGASNPLDVLRVGIFADEIEGAEAFNEQLADEAARGRELRADIAERSTGDEE